ncbi:MAG TPA: endonuclease III [Ignavibacteria bacterium]|nr:endonuclease III [Ignavibacteria bacterium]
MTESIKLKSTRASKILNILSNEYPDAGCHLDYNNPFELLISTLLAAQCTDERVNTVMVPLFKKYKTPNDFLNLKPAELEHELRSINFYRNKTKSVLNCCAALVNEHNSEVPKTMGELTKLAGVGRKTANVVLGNCFGEPAIMTDTHLNRVSQRLGLTDNDKPEKIEMDLKEIIPDKMQVQYSHVIGQHGRSVCKAKKPLCNECVVCELCSSCNNFN